MCDPDIVRLSVRDAGEILTLQRTAFLAPATVHQDMTLPPLVETVEQVVEDPMTTRLGIRIDGQLVASVQLRFRGTVAELGRLMVAPACQGRGLGTRLLWAVDQYLPDHIEEVDLFTGERSLASIRLYQRMGFAEVRRESAGDYDLVFMSRSVG